jgi:nucleotide-binding universal stress UspA family protein
MDTIPAVSRILVPTDFSPGSERAWDLARRLAVTHSAELCLLHVLPVTPLDIDARLRREEERAELRARAAEHQLAILRDDQIPGEIPQPAGRIFHGPLTADRIKEFSPAGCEWAAMLEDWAQQARKLGCKVQTELRTGAPSGEILAAAKEFEADLVVIGNHGHGNLHRLLLGSVADRVIRMAPCPVLTVKAATDRSAAG